MIAKKVHYAGHVQGVGFRYATKQIAMGYEVTGWVQNLPDGRVEMVAVAWEESELDDFLQGVIEGQLGGNIREIEVDDTELPEGLIGFSIR